MKVEQQYDEAKWKEVFGGAKGQLELSVYTYLILGNTGDYYFEFEGRPVRWCNGSETIAPVVITTVNDPDKYATEKASLRRFLSQLSYQQGIAIEEGSEIMSGKARLEPWLTQPYHFGGFKVADPHFKELKNLTAEQELAVALFREALNSSSTYYSILVFYKIIELASGPKKEWDWIEQRLDPHRIWRLNEWLKLVPQGKTPGQYMREAYRNAVTHVEQFLKTGDRTLSPDDLEQRAAASETNDILKQLAQMAMHLVVPLN